MRWPIRNQILVPFAAILLAAVAVISLAAAYLAANRSERAAVAKLNQMIETLGQAQANFPYSQNVLLQMRGLSGAEFAALDANDNILAVTLSRADVAQQILQELPLAGDIQSFAGQPAVLIGGKRYRLAVVARPAPSRASKLLVLYPETSLQQVRREAAIPPLIVGAATLVLMVLAAGWLAHRLGNRIRRVQQQVAAIADGNFRELEAIGPADEIRELIVSVNSMSGQLQQMQQTIEQTARSQLLGQLAGGLAHQLRNAVTGARMAIQIHAGRCSTGGDDSLDVALRQLQLTEEQVKGLLSVGKRERHHPVPRAAVDLVEEISALVGPACHHASIDWNTSVTGDCLIADSEGVKSAILNLALNGLEATSAGGRVELTAFVNRDGDPTVNTHTGREHAVFCVIDDGPGPPQHLADNMFDIFVTGKPEGVGLGLALAKQSADELGGKLTWNRSNERTEFRFEFPIASQPETLSPRGRDSFEAAGTKRGEGSTPKNNPTPTLPPC